MVPRTPHILQLDRAHADRSEEWHCPTCGRRIVLERMPTYRSHVLEAGDALVAHVGGGAPQWSAPTPLSPTLAERGPSLSLGPSSLDEEPRPFDAADRADELLRPWLKWLNEADLI